MTPNQAGSLAKKARRLLREGALKTRDICLLDVLMWSCRAPGMRQTAASLRSLARLTRMCKESVIDGLARLIAGGLLRKDKRRVRVSWGLGVASRQATNRYEFLPPATESAPATVIRGIEIKPKQSGLEVALQRLRHAVLDRGDGVLGVT